MKKNQIKSIFILMILFLLPIFMIAQNNEHIVQIHTDYGNIKIKLYNETPHHRDNFIKLTKEHFFDSTLFHRVINKFMIQGGDPDSKHARPGIQLGEGGPGYDIPAEINPKLFHKKGVIAAAREGDRINPEKKSSGSQFYIVQGKVFNDTVLNLMENKINARKQQEFILDFLRKPENKLYKNQFDSLQMSRNKEGIIKLITKLQDITKDEYEKQPPFKFSAEQRKAYTTIGGTPHLDGAYTVFGEVIKGFDVVDKIATVKTDKNNRPLTDIPMIVTIIK